MKCFSHSRIQCQEVGLLLSIRFGMSAIQAGPKDRVEMVCASGLGVARRPCRFADSCWVFACGMTMPKPLVLSNHKISDQAGHFLFVCRHTSMLVLLGIKTKPFVNVLPQNSKYIVIHFYW